MLNKIKRLQAKFRILDEWRISYNARGERKGQASINPETMNAEIYAWGDDDIPDDYILHEILHICCRYLMYVKSKGLYLVGREVEEAFVQDLCMLIDE